MLREDTTTTKKGKRNERSEEGKNSEGTKGESGRRRKKNPGFEKVLRKCGALEKRVRKARKL